MNENLSLSTVNHGALAVSDSNRKIAEIKASLTVARATPRDQYFAETQIMEACKRKGFAAVSTYSYPRGGQTVSGPSIRMAEMLALNWGNLEFGIRELERVEGMSTMEAFAWDLQSNVKRSIQFQVKHIRDKKGGGVKLTDERDIYEITANMGARRMRACVLNLIPGDIIEKAVSECRKTLSNGNNEPLIDQVKKMVIAFSQVGVTQAMLIDRLNHDLDAVTKDELYELRGIFTSIKESASGRDDWFKVESKPKQIDQSNASADDGDFAPVEKTVKKPRKPRTVKPKHDSTPIEEMEAEPEAEPESNIETPNFEDAEIVADPDVEKLFKNLEGHHEAAIAYAVEIGWIEEGEGLRDVKPKIAKIINGKVDKFIELLKGTQDA